MIINPQNKSHFRRFIPSGTNKLTTVKKARRNTALPVASLVLLKDLHL